MMLDLTYFVSDSKIMFSLVFGQNLLLMRMDSDTCLRLSVG